MLSADTKQVSCGHSLTVFLALAVMAAICACVTFLLLAANAAQGDLPRNALWGVVHNLCVPGQSLHHDPNPCLQADLTGGIENGFAILRDPTESRWSRDRDEIKGGRRVGALRHGYLHRQWADSAIAGRLPLRPLQKLPLPWPAKIRCS
jgi:CDP-diacylglycerol pyrophosphatase